MFEPQDIITCKSYQGLCDFRYDAPNLDTIPDSCVVHVPLDQIEKFFARINGNGQKYVVVSSCSDFGLAHQSEYPVYSDHLRWLQMQMGPHIKYQDIVSRARCDRSNCKLSDKYSVRCYSWTRATFPEIPDNVVKWYMTNCMVNNDNRIIGLPFGIAEKSENKFTNSLYNKPKTKNIYANWSLYTYERSVLRQQLKSCDNVTLIEEFRNFDDYLEELAEHKFVLCPNGNGVDCYRTLEAIYVGCIPVIEDSITTRSWCSKEMPIILMRELINFPKMYTSDDLDVLYYSILDRSCVDKLKLNYWNNLFKQDRKLLWQ